MSSTLHSTNNRIQPFASILDYNSIKVKQTNTNKNHDLNYSFTNIPSIKDILPV